MEYLRKSSKPRMAVDVSNIVSIIFYSYTFYSVFIK